MKKITRHLIRYPYRFWSHTANGLQVVLPKLVKLLARRRRNSLRKFTPPRSNDVGSELAHFSELSGAENIWVASENSAQPVWCLSEANQE